MMVSPLNPSPRRFGARLVLARPWRRTHLVKNDRLFCLADEIGNVVCCGGKPLNAGLVKGNGELDPCA